jgi:hypothetical protein
MRQYLANYVAERKCKTIAEIGVWVGQQARLIMGHPDCKVQEYWAIDPWVPYDDGQVRGGQNAWDTYYYTFIKHCRKVPEIHPVRLPSNRAVDLFSDHYFDLVYIDADHRLEMVCEDLRLWHPKVKRGGILCGDDYGNSLFPGVKQAVDEFMGMLERPICTIDDLRCGHGGRLWITGIL